MLLGFFLYYLLLLYFPLPYQPTLSKMAEGNMLLKKYIATYGPFRSTNIVEPLPYPICERYSERLYLSHFAAHHGPNPRLPRPLRIPRYHVRPSLLVSQDTLEAIQKSAYSAWLERH